ncbi:DNA-binding SARP family transcriptional activator [Actinoplanes lutulentus]|uniref:DNA-binding SARP family transcriptional activator n=1 Tax=Actinoplanes lutulentus TaxID=1287878 RepID=A0A327ZQE3_9ACTN|nr:tetratricopeptide repeat protein [Actinoplanes lutulentus]MBB2940798.1 DNA-binding SARP family transcriptional activator [Actinoplanes lutulentus]RAK43108.1 DNA-binding SARP family transcriptional activator [Actinoplanes lutulentus]
MALTVHLLGRPHVEKHGAKAGYQVRSRKSWALLAMLLLGDRPPLTRGRLAGMLYPEAQDPLRALRWGLTEVRRCLGVPVDGDPVTLRLPDDAVVDVHVLSHGAWTAAARLPGLGAELLDGIEVRGAPAFESWLLSERRRVAAASEAMLHEAALGRLAEGEPDAARDLALRAAAMNPLDENHQALVIRLYRLAGDDVAAKRQFAAVTELFRDELGVTPGIAVEQAMREVRRKPDEPADEASVEAIVESGAAAVAAGAVDAGVRSLRAAVRLADRLDGSANLRVTARLRLAESLVHSLRGMDEEGLATLHEADRLALTAHDQAASAQARAEIGYVDFLRGRYDRAHHWLDCALTAAEGSPATTARITTYLGAVHSDRGEYPQARALLEKAINLARDAGDPRTGAYALSMLGRVHLLLNDLDLAAAHLARSEEIAQGDHWLAFLPWPQALRGEVHLAAGDVEAAERVLRQAFARACRLGDPCWEGMAARSLALVAEARGDTEQAFALLSEARTRSNRLADPYVWLDAHILDAQCELGLRHGRPEAPAWIDALRLLTARTGIGSPALDALLGVQQA